MARIELTVYHEYFEKLLIYFNFRKHLLRRSQLYHCDPEVLFLLYKIKERQRLVFFSAAPRKVFNERPPDGHLFLV